MQVKELSSQNKVTGKPTTGQ